ncbi:MAG: sigma-54 dependent transcriptional regulator [Calditrichia bacterium]
MSAEAGKIEKELIGESPQIRQVIESSRKIAGSSSLTVLIYGESGTGKEVIARLIHEMSHFAQQPFVDLNCGAIPENLLESELFGYEKGAFTGAYKSKPGLFELARGGTIFLDEIGNTTANFQIKLLKIVENKTFRRIGGVQELSVSTRIIAATNVDLYDAVRRGKFREDLYYRLNVFQIQLPPLRKRNTDCLLLADHFIHHFNREYGRDIKGLSPSAAALIKRYPWPGNIRQLKNAIERAVLVESDEWVEAEDLSLDFARAPVQNAPPLNPNPEKQAVNFNKFFIPPEGIALDEVERDLILSALDQAGGNLSQAARLLKISRGKLRYRLEKQGIRSQHILKFRQDSLASL